MKNILAFDIGGANTKAAFIMTEKGLVKTLKTKLEYFPIWKRGKEQLPSVLRSLKEELTNLAPLTAVGVTMTAELSDAFFTKKEGVNYILDCVSSTFPDVIIFVLNVEAELISIEEAGLEPLKVASANWPATGWMISQAIKNCIIIDVGSTTTSIIPVINGKIAARGKTDLEKLMNGELIYTGSLRTNVAAILSYVPLSKGNALVSSEFFAQSGDAHLVLGNISEVDYVVETPDGRGKTRREAMARLARVICADIDMLSEQEIINIAQCVWEKQIEQISDGLKRVYEGLEFPLGQIPVVVTGLGRKFLAKRAAQKAGFKCIIDIGELLGNNVAIMSPSVGIALMVASKLEGEVVQWKPLLKLAEV